MGKSKLFILGLITFIISMLFLISAAPKNNATGKVFKYYKNNLDSLDKCITDMQGSYKLVDQYSLQQQFKEARYFYKKIEFLIDYHYLESASKLNGPNLPEAKISAPNNPLFPTGFQVLEEALFDTEEYNRQVIYRELSNIKFVVSRLLSTADEMELSESNILYALKLNLYRLITKGISGFDSPVALNSIEEAKTTIESTSEVLAFFPLSEKVTLTSRHTLEYLLGYEGDFDNFDRATFIVNFINPLCDELYEYQLLAKIPFSNYPYNAVAAPIPNLFSGNAFDLSFFSPANSLTVNETTINLGKRLFNDQRLSVQQNRSCATCHNPEKAFTDGLKVNESLTDGKKLLRNTPTLINAALQPTQFYDSRIIFLEDQVHDVIVNPSEMGGVFHVIAERLKEDKSYRKSFKEVFADGQVSERNIKSAIATYIRSLVYLNSPFDQYMRGEKNALTHRQINGFNLFMGKAKCGTCHFMPLFNGTVPPFFDKMESEVLGIPTNPDTLNAILDLDSGKFNTFKIPHQLYSFKTTTVRNAELTAPYMHNGVFETLEEVVDFYDRGGGAGIGIFLDHQTLPTERLNLSKEEKEDLILFIKSLTDTGISKKG